MQLPENALSVSELNEYVRRLLASDVLLRNLDVDGEISGYKHHISGHRYFALKDAGARVQCVMFRQNAMGLDFTPKDGMRVRVRASASLYAKDGSYQLYVTSMQKCGVGDLYAKFEQLKKKLEMEGLFDPAIKKLLPESPKCIGIVTSLTGAAIRDMIRVARRRNPKIDIIVAPCAVQGTEAAGEIVHAIERLNADGRCDVILCGRGGGSIEDLWAFNEEIVARAIAKSRIPVVSCVGHETDFTIADFVADVRAATPSMASEIAVPVLEEQKYRLNQLLRRITSGIAQANRLRRSELARVYAALRAPMQTLTMGKRDRIRHIMDGCARSISEQMRARRSRLDRTCAMIDAMNPERVLDRGYAYVTVRENVVSSAGGLKPGDAIAVQMRDGKIAAQITDIEMKEHPAHEKEDHL